MRILLVTIEAGGNLPPVLFLIRQLINRGHSVNVLGEPCLQTLVEDAGASFVSFKEYFIKTDRKKDMFEDWKSKNNGFKNVIFGPSKIVVKETVNAIKIYNPDIVIGDVVLPATLIAAEAMKVPAVSLFHMPEYLPGKNRPPGGLGLTPGKNAIGHLRDRVLGFVFDKIFNQYLSVINDIRKEYNLNPLKDVADLFRNVDLRLIQTSPAFDFPLQPLPANVKYTGPVLDDPDWVKTWKNPWPESDKRPLVVVSLSSTFQNQKLALSNCIEALSMLNVRGLVTLGLAMEGEAFSVPENVKIIDNGSHSEIFPHANCVITHAGHGTVVRALTNGLPMVCLPMGRDQGDNASKVEYHGTGIALSAKANAKTIKKAVDKILNNDKYSKNARMLGDKIMHDAQNGDIVSELEKLVVYR